MFTPEQAGRFLTTSKITTLGAIRKVTIGVKALANMRSRGIGPKYIKVRGKIYYEKEHLQAFKEELESR